MQLAARTRRALATSDFEDKGQDDSAARSEYQLVIQALHRHDAAPNLRIRGALGAGRRALVQVLHARHGWHFAIDDIDDVAAAGTVGAAPDVEVVLLCTTPCAHEVRWLARPRVHHSVVAVTLPSTPADRSPDRPHDVAGWESGYLHVDVDDPEHPGTQSLMRALSHHMSGIAEVRAIRLAAELQRVAASVEGGTIAEHALCGRPEHLTP